MPPMGRGHRRAYFARWGGSCGDGWWVAFLAVPAHGSTGA
jgi:hypothetical protein